MSQSTCRFDVSMKAAYIDIWEPWLLFMIEAVRETALWTTAKVRAIRIAASAIWLRPASPNDNRHRPI
jgi:hypothetical protein